jgi:hypothetical protein
LKGYGSGITLFPTLAGCGIETGIRDSPDTSRVGLPRNDLPKNLNARRDI